MVGHQADIYIDNIVPPSLSLMPLPAQGILGGTGN